MRPEIEEAARMLDEAADEVEFWGAYASEYFQDKWDLDGSVQKYRDYAAKLRDT
jgi:hypothetical protein